MSKYSIEDSTLTDIGDAVRTLVTANAMTPAQMKTNLQTASNLAAQQMTLIGQIKAALDGKAGGAGGGNPGVAYGFVTPASANETITVEHGLGEQPSIIMWGRSGYSTSTSAETIYAFAEYGTGGCALYRSSSNGTITMMNSTSSVVNGLWDGSGSATNEQRQIHDVTDVSFTAPKSNNSAITYIWVAIADA